MKPPRQPPRSARRSAHVGDEGAHAAADHAAEDGPGNDADDGAHNAEAGGGLINHWPMMPARQGRR